MNELKKCDCKRCGLEIYSRARSHFGLSDSIREKYAEICARCMNRKEQAEMLEAMGKSMAMKFERCA